MPPNAMTERQARGTAVMVSMIMWVPLLLGTPAALAMWIKHDDVWPLLACIGCGFGFFTGAAFMVFAALGGLMEESEWRRRKKNSK